MRLAKRYYAKLYREYAIVDLSRYKVSILPSTHVRRMYMRMLFLRHYVLRLHAAKNQHRQFTIPCLSLGSRTASTSLMS